MIETKMQNSPMKKDNFHIDIFSVFVKKVFEKVRHRLVRDVTAHHDMSAVLLERRKKSINFGAHI